MKTGYLVLKDIVSNNRFDGTFHLSDAVIYEKAIKQGPHNLLSNLTERIFTAGRSKRIYTSKEYGNPYLNNTDVISINPFQSCKYVSKKYSRDENSVLKEGMIVTGRVGAIGQTAYITNEYDENEAMGSDNIIRIIANSEIYSGYLYAFLASKFGTSFFWKIASGGVQPYISEPALFNIPVPLLSEFKQNEIKNLISESSKLRTKANGHFRSAIKIFEDIIGLSDANFSYQTDMIPLSQVLSENNRIDSQFQILKKKLSKEKKIDLDYKTIYSLSKEILIGGRDKRNYTKTGIPFLSSSDILLFNPLRNCKTISKRTPNIQRLTVKKNTILITRSGTVGKTVIVGDNLKDSAISEHAIRLIIDDRIIEPHYVFAYLNTNQGLKHLESSAFGSVIITLNEDSIGNIEIPILKKEFKDSIVNHIKQYQFDLDRSTLLENMAIDIIEKEVIKWQN